MDSLISVIVPTYNRAHCIEQTLRSVLDQSYRFFELIVVDDGSTDNTHEILGRFGDSIRVITQVNSGVSAARNQGMYAARGRYLAFLDSDDLWLPGKLEHQIRLMHNDGVVFSATNWQTKDEHDSSTAFSSLPFDDSWICDRPTEFVSRRGGHNIMLSSWIVQRDVIAALGGFDTSVDLAEDNHLLFRLAFRGRFALTKKVLLLRETGVDDVKLSRPGNDLKYQRKAVRSMCLATGNAKMLAFSDTKLVQRQFGKLYSYYLRREMELAALDRNSWAVRRRAVEVWSNHPCLKDAVMAAIGIVSPAYIRMRERKKFFPKRKPQ
jgi:glycosyltransferase involved in cell wall biosynthesis